MPEQNGSNCIVLHAHLPYIHHPTYEDFLEEDWYFEAMLETYLPIIWELEQLEADAIPVRLSVGLTPPLLEMFRSPALRAKTERYLLQKRSLAESETRRLRADKTHGPTAAHYLRRISDLYELWQRGGGDVVALWKERRDAGQVQILAGAATHAVLPLLATDAGRRAQIEIGVALFREAFGEAPTGFWLPECAYQPGLDQQLVASGLRATVLESHGVRGASPAPRTGVFRPLCTPAGLRAFGRDAASSRQVWAQEIGYPGDPAYRELYRDLGFDGAYDYVKRWLHKDGVRRNMGIKYHRVTGKVELHEKAPWIVKEARARATLHAGNYLWHRGEQVKHLHTELGITPVVTSPYDMELFGHWWYEGPWFLSDLFRVAADPNTRPPLRLLTPDDVLRESDEDPRGEALLSTWGEGGFLKVWMNEKNAWVLRHQHELERRMIERAREHPDADPRTRRLLNQLLRELLLLQSSDWAFIITKETSVHYAKKRVTDHVDRFLKIHSAIEGTTKLDDAELAEIERDDALFPGLDYRVMTGGAAHLKGESLGTPLTQQSSL